MRWWFRYQKGFEWDTNTWHNEATILFVNIYICTYATVHLCPAKMVRNLCSRSKRRRRRFLFTEAVHAEQRCCCCRAGSRSSSGARPELVNLTGFFYLHQTLFLSAVRMFPNYIPDSTSGKHNQRGMYRVYTRRDWRLVSSLWRADREFTRQLRPIFSSQGHLQCITANQCQKLRLPSKTMSLKLNAQTYSRLKETE